MRKIIPYACLILAFVSCSKENTFDCFKSNGDDVTDVRQTGAFTIVEVNDQINLNVVNGPEFKVEVTAGKHIIKNILTTVKNNTLSIDNNNKCNFVRGYKRQVTVTVTVPKIKKVSNLGVGTVFFDNNFSQDTLLLLAESSGDIHVNGTYKEIRTTSHGNGDIFLNGTCNSLYVYMNGINFFRGENMPIARYIFVETLSIGACHVNATLADTLDYHIWSSGDIYYKGNPPSIGNVSDGSETGKLIKEN